jgi:DDE superfamily endonuclease
MGGAGRHDVYDLSELSSADPERPPVVHSGLPQAEPHETATWTLVRDAPVESDPMDACLIARGAQHPAPQKGCPLSRCGGLARTPGDGGTILALGPITRRSGTRRATARNSPVGHDGTERPIPRHHDTPAQKTCERGKNKRHMLKNLLLINPALRILFLSEMHAGSVHDKGIPDTTPALLPTGSQLLQETAFKPSRWTAWTSSTESVASGTLVRHEVA